MVTPALLLPIETVKMRLQRARAGLYDELRAHCHCYYNERSEIMGDLKWWSKIVSMTRMGIL